MQENQGDLAEFGAIQVGYDLSKVNMSSRKVFMEDDDFVPIPRSFLETF